jgi:hypothetical protein
MNRWARRALLFLQPACGRRREWLCRRGNSTLELSMSETSLNSGYDRNLAQSLRHRLLLLTPYAAFSVIAGIVFGTLSTHPF